jgi:acyl dehydratase
MKFEDLHIGDTLGPLELFVTKDQTRAYARSCGLDAPRFTDDEGAKKEGLPGMILPGNMSLGLLAKLVTDWIGASGARMVRLGTTYRVPVQPDHTLTLSGFVTNAEPGERIAEIDVWIENEDAERLVTGTASVQFPPAS